MKENGLIRACAILTGTHIINIAWKFAQGTLVTREIAFTRLRAHYEERERDREQRRERGRGRKREVERCLSIINRRARNGPRPRRLQKASQ